MHDTYLTISGNLVDSPKLRRTKNGHLVANFRVASTPRRFDREKGEWVDERTLFVTVTAWRGMAENVSRSLQKGEPVVVHGRYYQREYEQEEVLRTAYELEAISVGHDLSRGTSEFTKVTRSSMVTVVDNDDAGPADQTTNYLDLDGAQYELDPATGELREIDAPDPDAERELVTV